MKKNKKKITKPKKKIEKSNINVANKIAPSRLIFILLIVVIFMIALIIRVGFLQFVDGSRLQTLATSQQTLTETISAKRGNIYDSKGNALAISYDTDKVYIEPSLIKDDTNKNIVAQGLASILELDSNELLTNMNSSTGKILVASEVEQSKIDEITNWKSKLKFSTGISFEESTSRSYPSKNLASTVIGFVGTDNQGLSGIESSWDSFLRGTAGKSVSLKDAYQSEIANSNQTYIAAENGYDVTLTIDSNIQSIVEKYLAQAVDEYKCQSGITIAMDPSTGKILAMADYPNYDCNTPYSPNSYLSKTWDTLSSEDKSSALYRMWSPKAVTDMYEEDVNPDEIMPCASNGTISWDVYAGVRRSTSSFHASSGQRIVLSVFSVEPFHSVRAGIIQPDGSKRYIIATGNDSHIFELTMSGSYRIYIQNETTEMVHVEGAYSTH